MTPAKVARRVALKNNNAGNFAGLDVWQYDKAIRGGQGSNRTKLAQLWEQLYGAEPPPAFEQGHFAPPLLPEMMNSVSPEPLDSLRRFVDRRLLISIADIKGNKPHLRLTICDGAIWVGSALDAFIRASPEYYLAGHNSQPENLDYSPWRGW